MANENLSNTTVHTPILEPEVATIVSHLRELRSQGGTVVAMPGLAVESGKDQYELLVQDLNPIVSGWVGLHTFAGHWSETPNYAERRRTILESVYFSDNPISGLAAIQASYLITPTGDFARSLGINTDALLAVGRPVFVGERWALIRVGD